MHKLIIEDDEGRKTVVPLVRDEMTIGRKEGNTIRLTERNVSRRHARIVRQGSAVYIEDLASYTGIRVNGVRITGLVPMKDGDNVQIGDYKLYVRGEGAPDTVAAMPAVPPAAAPAVAPGPPTPHGVPSAMLTPPPAAPFPGATVAAMPVVAPAPAPAPAGAPAAPIPVDAAATPLPVVAAPAAGAPAAAAAAAAAGVPRARLDAGPTTPLRPGGEPAAAAPAPLGPPARLVVVSTDLAGMEFRLDRAAQVIGRTDENDILINHPSISRHHAKLVRDGDRYSIVDLQSANGVRVGGLPYDRVDLQAGDIIELGHVRARFVGPFEDWFYDPAEFAPPPRRGLKIGAAIGGVALAVVVIFLVQGAHKTAPVATAPAAPGAPPAAAPSGGGAVPPAAPQAAAGPAPDQLFADASAAAASESWDKAVTALDVLLSRPAGDPTVAALRPRAADLKRKVDRERRSAEAFAAFKEAYEAARPDDALARYGEIPADSVYKTRADATVSDVRRMFVAAHLDLADKARAIGRCDEARGEADKIAAVEPDNRRAREIVRGCRAKPEPRVAAATATVAAAERRPPAPPPARAPLAAGRPAGAPPRPAASPRVASASAGEPRAPVSPPAASESDEPSASELIKQAREAWMRQQCPNAIDLSRRALKSKPGSTEAHQIIAACSCTLRDREGALRAYGRLDDRSRNMVRALCARNGVELGE